MTVEGTGGRGEWGVALFLVKRYNQVSETLTEIKGSCVCIAMTFFSLLAKTYGVNFHHQLLARVCSKAKWENFF